ncbi:MAG: hypothetical protein NVSMB13_14300 [Mycobacteriales bacterium]
MAGLVDREPVGPARQRLAAHLAGRPAGSAEVVGQQRVAAGVGDHQPARTVRYGVGGPVARRERPDRGDSGCVVDVEPRAADVDDAGPVPDRADPARLDRAREARDDPGLRPRRVLDHRHAAAELVGDHDPTGSRRRVVWLATYLRVLQHRPAGQRHRAEQVAVLAGQQDRPAGSGQLEVPGRPRDVDDAGQPAGSGVHQREGVGLAQGDGDRAGPRIGDDALRLSAAAEGDHRTGRRRGQ